MMNYYLGQQIELIEEEPGWVGIWSHESGEVGIGYFPTAEYAWDAVVGLIQRDLAVRAVLDVVNEWLEVGTVKNHEYVSIVDSLMHFVLT
ncbi:hypothetical protein [Leptothermofonsia sp. ETS-13]|uniref:hypothetical protein n=1 Tax=Leptothermofonsia sp. ETS-13 TaxID=3035696 RepID=UPI003BA17635